ncbi:MAG: DMT family transporter [Hydrogenibacillus schlegelii]|uniref:DMT family transporter n=1 Tax=Hydrogenibacillus schlegelii TaxID=1484 RepID=A0A947CXG1_HYDSH|nr:DMT family transporter [Hydrogenibacillus schlegelii]
MTLISPTVPSRRTALAGDLALLFVTFVWGTTFVVVQDAIAHLPPFSFLAVRFGLAFLLLLPFALRSGGAGATRAGIGIGLFLFGGYAFQTFGLLFTTPARSGFITGLSVVLVPALSALWLRERVPPAAWAGVALAFGGVLLLAAGGRPDPADGPAGERETGLGDLLTFLGALSFALQIVATARASRRHPPAALATFQLGTVAVLSAAAAFAVDGGAMLDPAPYRVPAVALGLFVTAVLATALAYWVQSAAGRRTSPVHMAIIFALEPVFAALTSWATGHEPPAGRVIAGGLFIVFGMLVAELPSAVLAARASGSDGTSGSPEAAADKRRRPAGAPGLSGAPGGRRGSPSRDRFFLRR